LEDLKREEFTHISAKRVAVLDLVQKIKEEVRTWDLAREKFLSALIVDA
jgi:hypothetical protein